MSAPPTSRRRRLGGQYICDHIAKGSDVAILQGIMAIVNGSDRAQGSHRRA